ncbi:MAG: hypothetical protein JXA83_14655, partial [Acidimicrobiales bacterium]|nr:hypothetical protein [Acidimicrobiales bacterium]
AGENATLGAYLEGAGVDLSDDELTIGDDTWAEGDAQCGDEDAEILVAQWKDVQNTDDKPALIRRDFNDIRFREDGEGYTVAVVPEGTTDIPKPESAAQLAELGALDTGPGATTDDPNATTEDGGEPPDDGAPDEGAPDDTSADDPTATTAADDTATTLPEG